MIMQQQEEMVANFGKALQEFQKLVDEKKFKKQQLLKDSEQLQAKIDELDIDNYEKAATWLEELAKNQKKAASEELSKLGTMALQYSFGPNYRMQIEMSGTVKSPRAELWLIKNDNEDEKEDPLEDNGGGIVDIIGTAMRIVIMDNYTDPVIDGPIIFDEPFKMVSKEYIPQLSQFISNVAKDFGRQVIAVTHNDYLSSMTDSNIYISLDSDEASVVEVQSNRKEI